MIDRRQKYAAEAFDRLVAASKEPEEVGDHTYVICRLRGSGVQVSAYRQMPSGRRLGTGCNHIVSWLELVQAQIDPLPLAREKVIREVQNG